MKSTSAADLSDGVLAVSDDIATKLTSRLSKATSPAIRAIVADIKAGRFEEAKTAARELEFTDPLAKSERVIRRFTQAAALVGVAAIDKPQTSIMAQAGFPYEVDTGAVRLIQNMIDRQLTRDTRRRMLDRINRAERFQKASDPIDPDDLAKNINRFLRGEIRRVVDVSSNLVGTRVSAYGMLHEARARGITRYRIDAVIDDRTTDICQNLNGRIYTVEEAFTRTQIILNTTDPDQLKKQAPFPKLSELEGESDEDLQRRGFDVPPFHFLCRTVITLIDSDVEYESVPITKFPDKTPNLSPSKIERLFESMEPLAQAALGVASQAALLEAKEAAGGLVRHPGGDGAVARAYAATVYSGNAFSGINATLRRKHRWESDDQREIARTMDRAIADVPPLEESIIVYRGVSGAALEQMNDIGKVVQDDGFVSTSVSPGVALDFGSKDAVLQILIPAGQRALPMGDLSLTKFEAEILLPRSTQMRVVGVSEIETDAGPQQVVRVVVQGQTKAPDLDDLPNFDDWIEEQESLIKLDAEAERSRVKFFYTTAKDIFQVGLG